MTWQKILEGLKREGLVKVENGYIICSRCGFSVRLVNGEVGVAMARMYSHFLDKHRDDVLKIKCSNGNCMRLISVHLPEWMIRELERLVMEGYFPSRSEAIRVAVHQLIMSVRGGGLRNNMLVMGR